MADINDPVDAEAIAALRKKRQFRKFQFRGIELDKLLDLSHEELLNFVNARARRRMQRGLKRKPMALVKKLRKAKAGECAVYCLVPFESAACAEHLGCHTLPYMFMYLPFPRYITVYILTIFCPFSLRPS